MLRLPGRPQARDRVASRSEPSPGSAARAARRRGRSEGRRTRRARRFGPCGRSGQRTPSAADLVQRHAAVERDRLAISASTAPAVSERRHVEARAALPDLHQHLPPGRTSPGWPIAGRSRCRRPSGCVTVPSFSAYDSAGNTTSAWRSTDSLRNCSCATTKPARRAPASHSSAARAARAAGPSAAGRRRFTSPRRPRPWPARAASPPGASDRPGPMPGTQPTSRRPRRVRAGGDLDQPGPSAPRPARAAAPGRPAPRARRRRARPARAARPRSRPCSRRRSAGAAASRRSCGRRPAVREALERVLGEEPASSRARAGRAAASRPPPPLGRSRRRRPRSRPPRASPSAARAAAPPRRRARTAAPRWRRRRARSGALDGDHQPRAEAAHRLAQAQVEDRRLVHRVGLQHQHDRGAVDVGRRGRELGLRRAAARARARAGRPRASRRCGEPSPSRKMRWSS